MLVTRDAEQIPQKQKVHSHIKPRKHNAKYLIQKCYNNQKWP